MAESTVEIDFFQIDKQKASCKPPSSSQCVGSSHPRIQNVVSKINPQLLKTVMAAGAAGTQARSVHGISSWTTGHTSQSSSNPSSPSTAPAGDTNWALLYPLPVLNPASRSALPGHPETPPLTIFYNGTVTTFDVPRDKAEAIIRMAESGIVEDPVERPADPSLDDLQVGAQDLPIARRKSLQRFLENRKGRYRAPAEPFSFPSSLSAMAPYPIEQDSAE